MLFTEYLFIDRIIFFKENKKKSHKTFLENKYHFLLSKNNNKE
jgi:hypothetical protein